LYYLKRSELCIFVKAYRIVKARRVTTVIFMLDLLLSVGMGARTTMAIEKAEYRTLLREGNFELRQYEPHIVAETYVESNFGDAVSEGFSRLFRYIQGSNRKRESISMTAPVTQEPGSVKISMTAPVTQEPEGNRWRITFLMPSSYTVETLPEPLDTRVQIRFEEGRLIASLRYSGNWSEERFRKKEEELHGIMEKKNLRPVGGTIFARYNPPFLPSFLRRNEVHIPVERNQ
jgi:hypothetical protein